MVCLQVVHLEDVSCLLLVSQCPGGGGDTQEPDAPHAPDAAPTAMSSQIPEMVPPQDVDGEEVEEEEPLEDEVVDVE